MDVRNLDVNKNVKIEKNNATVENSLKNIPAIVCYNNFIPMDKITRETKEKLREAIGKQGGTLIDFDEKDATIEFFHKF